MSEPLVPSVVVNVCHNCIPQVGGLPRQWRQSEGLVVVRELPCTGKLDLQYLLHAVESVGGGVCVVACPLGQCRLAQGNQRARIRIETLRRLLAEIGLESERAELLHCAQEEPTTNVERAIREAVERILKLGPNPLCSTQGSAPSGGLPRDGGLGPAPREFSARAASVSTTDGILE